MWVSKILQPQHLAPAIPPYSKLLKSCISAVFLLSLVEALKCGVYILIFSFGYVVYSLEQHAVNIHKEHMHAYMPDYSIFLVK